MDSARSWLQKLQQREKVSKKKEQGLNGVDESYEEEHSSATRQRVATAKQYIENHYKEQMKNLQERKERYMWLWYKKECDSLVYSIIN